MYTFYLLHSKYEPPVGEMVVQCFHWYAERWHCMKERGMGLTEGIGKNLTKQGERDLARF